jgi:hypothetical protein
MKENIKPLVWGIVIGAIGFLIIIFWSGWVVTRGTAEAEGRKMAKKAVLEQLVPICVEQYHQDPNKVERFKELKEEAYYLRDDYVIEKGWAKMPGSKSPLRGLADECAKKIIEIESN